MKDTILRTSSRIVRHEEISSRSGMVVAQHVTAAKIGVEVIQRGGNAVAAAVTTAFASGVLLPHGCCFLKYATLPPDPSAPMTSLKKSIRSPQHNYYYKVMPPLKTVEIRSYAACL